MVFCSNMPPTSLCQQGTQSSLLKGPCTRSFNRSTFLGMHFQILVYDSNHMRTVKVVICWVGRRRAFLEKVGPHYTCNFFDKKATENFDFRYQSCQHASSGPRQTHCSSHAIEKKHKETERQTTTTNNIHIIYIICI